MKKILLLGLCMYAGVQASQRDLDITFHFAYCALGQNHLSMLRDMYHKNPMILTHRVAEGRTILHYADVLEPTEFLIMAGADINATDDYQVSPLLHAVCCNRDDIVALFLQHKADMNIKNFVGKTVFDLHREPSEAADPKVIRIKNLLEQAQEREKKAKESHEQEKALVSSE